MFLNTQDDYINKRAAGSCLYARVYVFKRCVELSLSEHSGHSTNASDECIHFFACVVKSETGTHSALYAQSVHQRFGTMMACAYCYA